MLDDAAAACERDAAGERSREAAEGSVVVTAEDQQVVPAAALGLGTEAKHRAVLAADAREIAREGDRGDLVRLAGDPHRALAAVGRIVDAADEVPCDRHPIRALADAGAPSPLGVARMMAGRVIDHGQRLDLARVLAVDGQRPARTHARLLPRPDPMAPVGAQRLDAGLFLEGQVALQAAVANQHSPPFAAWPAGTPAPTQPPLPAARQKPRAFPRHRPPAEVSGPEGLPRRTDLDERRACDQLVTEDPHIAPALQGPQPPEHGHARGTPRPIPRAGVCHGRYAWWC